jgi:SNF2 family DNA or RNA helicase
VGAVEELFVTESERRWRVSERVKAATDVNIPRLKYWNYDPCKHHDVPQADCAYRACGGDLFKHQRVGVSWLYTVGRGILADQTGLGKTNEIIALCCLMKERGELTERAVVVSQTTAVEQWHREFRRFAPRLNVITATGDRRTRIERYTGGWDVLVIGYHMFLRDVDMLMQLEPCLLVADDVDPLRSSRNATAVAYNRLARQTERVININATPLQTKLQDLYSVSISVGGDTVFGTLRAFERRYVRTEEVSVYTRTGRRVKKQQILGYKNMHEFRDKITPLYLRRTYDDVDDVAIPSVAPHEEVWLDLTKRQREAYKDLQKGVINIINTEGQRVSWAASEAKFLRGQQICAGMFNLDEADGPDASVKLDWFMDKITGDWADEKVVMFSQFKGTIKALHARLQEQGIGMAVVWGDTKGGSAKKAAIRAAEQKRFWDDPNCRVCVGTSAIERSLNLQAARIVVNFDTLLNPSRMTQILGRVRRVGSHHDRVYPFTLLTRNTQEERYMAVLEQRQAMSDFVFDEESPLYEKLTGLELLNLIGRV